MAIELGKIDSQIIYANGNVLAGVGTVTLPVIEALNEVFNNSAVAGEIQVASTTKFKAMTAVFKFQSFQTDMKTLFDPSQKVFFEINSGMPLLTNIGVLDVKPDRIVLGGQIYKMDAGERADGGKNEPTFEMNVWQITMEEYGVPILEFDVFNPYSPLKLKGSPVGLGWILKQLL